MLWRLAEGLAAGAVVCAGLALAFVPLSLMVGNGPVLVMVCAACVFGGLGAVAFVAAAAFD